MLGAARDSLSRCGRVFYPDVGAEQFLIERDLTVQRYEVAGTE